MKVPKSVWMLFVIFFGFVVQGAFVAAEQEKIKEGCSIFNPSFEILEDGKPVGWVFHPNHPKSIIKVTERPDGKGKCLFMKASEEATKGEQTNCDACSVYEIPVKPSTSYILSASLHGRVTIFTFFYDRYTEGEKVWWTADIKEARKYYLFEGRNLERKSVKFTSPQGAKSVQIMIRNQPYMKEAWIDDLEIKEDSALTQNKNKTATELKTGLVAYYNFDEKSPFIKDLTGNGNTGVSVGEIFFERGPMGNAFKANGNTYINCGSSALLKPKKTLSLTCWIKILLIHGDDLAIVSNLREGKYAGYIFKLKGVMDRKASVVLYSDKNNFSLNGNKDLNDGKWHFLAFTFKKPEVKIYVDGMLDAQGIWDYDIFYSDEQNFFIGGRYASHYFNGLIDEVKFYNVALTEEEIKDEFKKGEKLSFADTEILLPWHSWIRGEEIPLEVYLTNPEQKTGRITLKVLRDEKLVDFQLKEFSFKDQTKISFVIRTDFYSLGDYKMIISAEGFPTREEKFSIVSDLEGDTIGFGFYGYTITGLPLAPFTRGNIAAGLDLVSSANMNLFLMAPYLTNVYFLDEAIKRGIGWIPLLSPRETSPEATENDYSLTSEGKRQTAVHASEKNPHLSYISPLARKLLAKFIPASLPLLKDHPAFSKKVYFGDDTFIARGSTWKDYMWGPLADYGYYPTKIFKEKTGLEPPQPTREELQKVKGIIPDNDPWLLWNHFRCEDIFADYQALTCKTIKEKLGAVACSEHGAVWLPGWGFCPSSEQKVLTLPGYYRYPTSPYTHMFEVGLVRLGAGNRDITVTPAAHNNCWNKWFSEEVTPEYERAVFHSILSAGGKIITYCPFQTPAHFDKGHPAVWEEWRRQGEIIKKYGKLLYALKRKKEPIGLLISFSTDVYRLLDEREPGQTFPYFHGHKFRVGGTFFSMLKAQIPVEMVDEERILSGDLSHYKVIYLADVTVLPSSVAKALEGFISRGGIVMMDNLCEVDIKGAQKLSFKACVLPSDRRDRCSIPDSPLSFSPKAVANAVEQLRKTFKGIVQPVLKTNSVDIVAQRFISDDGEEYLYLLNLNQDDFTKARIEFIDKQEAVDIFSNQRVRSGDTVELPPAGGMLLSFQRKVDDITINAPDKVYVSDSFSISLKFLSGGHPSGLIPFQLMLLNPQGKVEKEWSKYYLARSGKLTIPVRLSSHSLEGNYTIIAEDLIFHKLKTRSFKVLPELKFEVEKRTIGDSAACGFLITVKNLRKEKREGKIFLIASKFLNSSFPEDGLEISLSAGESKQIPVDIVAKHPFSFGLQPFEFILKMKEGGSFLKENFATLAKGEKKEKEPDLAPLP